MESLRRSLKLQSMEQHACCRIHWQPGVHSQVSHSRCCTHTRSCKKLLARHALVEGKPGEEGHPVIRRSLRSRICLRTARCSTHCNLGTAAHSRAAGERAYLPIEVLARLVCAPFSPRPLLWTSPKSHPSPYLPQAMFHATRMKFRTIECGA